MGLCSFFFFASFVAGNFCVGCSGKTQNHALCDVVYCEHAGFQPALSSMHSWCARHTEKEPSWHSHDFSLCQQQASGGYFLLGLPLVLLPSFLSFLSAKRKVDSMHPIFEVFTVSE